MVASSWMWMRLLEVLCFALLQEGRSVAQLHLTSGMPPPRRDQGDWGLVKLRSAQLVTTQTSMSGEETTKSPASLESDHPMMTWRTAQRLASNRHGSLVSLAAAFSDAKVATEWKTYNGWKGGPAPY